MRVKIEPGSAYAPFLRFGDISTGVLFDYEHSPGVKSTYFKVGNSSGTNALSIHSTDLAQVHFEVTSIITNIRPVEEIVFRVKS